jgi:phospholipid/cholesterol/gamma-HCH transport system substrate-binding protein
MKSEVKIGIFLSIAILIVAVFIFVVGDLNNLLKKPGYSVFIYFDSAAGLEKRTVVRMAGVKMGFVQDIRLKGSQAEVVLSVNPDVKLPVDSKATLAALGLLGEKYIEILPGSAETYCQPGGSIAVIPPVSLDQLGTELYAISTEIRETGKVLREMIGGEEAKGNIKEIFESLAQFASDLKEFSESNKQGLGLSIQRTSEAIHNFDNKVNEVSQSLDELVSLLKEMVEENRENVKANFQNIKELVNKADSSLQRLNDTMEKISAGEGSLGKLIRQPELYDDAEETMGEIKRAIRPLSSFRAEAGLHFEYFAEANLVKSFLSFNLWPTPSKYLMTQVVQDPFLDKFTFSAQAGIRWGYFSPRAGIMQSKIGAGVDFYVWGDRLKFSLESFDFNRRPNPHFRFFTSYSASKYLYLLFGLDDFAESAERELFFGLGLGL